MLAVTNTDHVALGAKTKPGLSPRGPASCSSLSKKAISNRGVIFVGSRNHPDSRRAFNLRTGRNPPMGRRGLGSRRGRSRIRRSAAGGLSGSATATLGGSAATAIGRGTAAATAVLAETTEQLELAAAGAATARLGRTAARLGGAGRLFLHHFGTARRLDRSGTATAGLFRRTAAATAMVTAEQIEAGLGFALHGDHRTDQSHHSKGGLHCKTLTHRKSSN